MTAKVILHHYYLDTGLASCNEPTSKFSSDEAAWNHLAKKMDARYKTGGKVIAILYKEDCSINNIHKCQEVTATTSMPVATGYISSDWNGTPWNNKTYCGLCGCNITPERFRIYNYCRNCSPVIDSLHAWGPMMITPSHPGKQRLAANITPYQLQRLKVKSKPRWKDAVFLIRDGTLTLTEQIGCSSHCEKQIEG